MPKTTHIQHFSGELKFTAIECIIQEGLTIFIYNEPTQKLVEPIRIIPKDDGTQLLHVLSFVAQSATTKPLQ